MAKTLYIERRENMTYNLRAEMARLGIKNTDISNAIKVNEKTFRNKLNGLTPFTFPETKIIRDTFFAELKLEYLFENLEHKKVR